MECFRKDWKMFTILVFVAVLSTKFSVTEAKNKMFYVCPPDFMRLGNSCYFFSKDKIPWQKAFFACKERHSNLSAPERWEDRNLRNHLNAPGIDRSPRWIGGIYDYGARAFKWGGELKEMKYSSSIPVRNLAPEKLKWHCIAMLPEAKYMWGARSCLERNAYICQSKLKKVSKNERNHLREMGMSNLANEITAPSLEAPDAKQSANYKGYDIRPGELKKRANGARRERRLKKLFKGFVWIRNDPEAEYRQNVEILRSGTTGLSPQQVSRMISRLEKRRDNKLKRRLNRHDDDWLTHDGGGKKKNLKYAKHLTYTMDNQISDLHPKPIVEVHEFEDLITNRV